MQSSVFGSFGNLLSLIALILAFACGFMDKPAIESILASSFVSSVGYVLARLPQMRGVYERDGLKIVSALLYLLIAYAAVAGILYAVGLGIGKMF